MHKQSPAIHTEERWLSREKALKWAFELCDELNVFNQKARLQFEALFSDKSELQKRIYLVDIFAILNELNLYGKDQTHHASICPKRSDQSKSDLSFG